MNPAVSKLGPTVALLLTVLSGEVASGAPAIANALRPGRITARAGMGMTFDPTAFLIAGQGDYYIIKNLSLGPLVQLAVDDDETMAAISVNACWTLDLPGTNLERLKPFIQGGAGFAYLEDEDTDGDPDDIGLMLHVGPGVEYFLRDDLTVGTSLLFNIFPDKLLEENLSISWQMITVRFLF